MCLSGRSSCVLPSVGAQGGKAEPLLCSLHLLGSFKEVRGK